MSSTLFKIGSHTIEPGHPCYVIAEIGINHNGDINTALKLIEVAASAGCDAVKFQKRTPYLCVPPEQREIERDTPWGRMSYLKYKERIELDLAEYELIAVHATAHGLDWFCSCWDEPSVHDIARLKPDAMKVASATLTNHGVLRAMADTQLPILISTGMSTLAEVDAAVDALNRDGGYALLQTTSAYPCDEASINLRAMESLRARYRVPVGYSGHERGLQVTLAAVALGANVVERHITLDRTMWGTDQSASLEPHALHRLVRDIRLVEKAMGDGNKRVMDCERDALRKLRGA